MTQNSHSLVFSSDVCWVDREFLQQIFLFPIFWNYWKKYRKLVIQALKFCLGAKGWKTNFCQNTFSPSSSRDQYSKLVNCKMVIFIKLPAARRELQGDTRKSNIVSSMLFAKQGREDRHEKQLYYSREKNTTAASTKWLLWYKRKLKGFSCQAKLYK